MIIPLYSITIDPTPKKILSKETFSYYTLNGTVISPKNLEQYRLLFNTSDPTIKTIAGTIISNACSKENRVCDAKALYYFTRDNFEYISDPISKEYVEEPKLFFSAGGGDCESGSVFLAALLESVGIDTQLVFTTNHALVRVWIPEASKRHKDTDDWIYLDWTCDSCEFGYTKNIQNKITVEIP